MRIDADIAPYPTYVGYGAIYAAHISDRHPIRIRMAIPKLNTSPLWVSGSAEFRTSVASRLVILLHFMFADGINSICCDLLSKPLQVTV